MTTKEARSLFEFIISDKVNTYFYVGDMACFVCGLIGDGLKKHKHLERKMIAYLESLNMEYGLAKKIINSEDVYFYHVGDGNTGEALPENPQRSKLTESRHIGELWITDEGRIGIWSDTDGFVAWLDEYKTMWISNLDENGAQ